ncbi:hypothetical protein QTP88_012990 [Uroleucon formosanum]
MTVTRPVVLTTDGPVGSCSRKSTRELGYPARTTGDGHGEASASDRKTGHGSDVVDTDTRITDRRGERTIGAHTNQTRADGCVPGLWSRTTGPIAVLPMVPLAQQQSITE